MATSKLPGGIYSGGDVQVSTQPIANMYSQFMQHQIARDEALDNYFRDQNKTVNPAGMRNQDITGTASVPGLTQKQSDWQQFYQQNKQPIKNPKLDNGKAYTEYESRHRDIINYIDQSKNAAKTTDELSKAKLNPQLGYIFDDNEIMGKIHQHDLPLNDPNHKDLSLAELSIQPKPLDTKEWEGLNKSFTQGLKPKSNVVGSKVDPATLDTVTTYKDEFSPEDLQTIGNRAKSNYQLDRRVRSTVDKNLLNSPNAPQLNDIYKQTYGKNAETPADLLAAQAIQNATTGGNRDVRTPGSFESKKLLQEMRDASLEKRIKMRFKFQQMGKAMDDVWVENHVQKQIADAEKNDFQKFTIGGQELYEKPMNLDPVTAKALARNGVEPDMVTTTNKGGVRGIYYKYDNQKTLANGKPNPDYGKPQGIDEDLSRNVFSPEQLKLAISGKTESAKQRAQEMNTGQQQQTIIPHTHKGMLD